MSLPDTVMIVGLCLVVASCVFLMTTHLRTFKQAGGQEARLTRYQRAARLELYMAAAWTGILLVQVSNLFHHAQPDGTTELSWLSLAGAGGAVFACGEFAGRLSLRREMRLLEEQPGDIDCAGKPS